MQDDPQPLSALLYDIRSLLQEQNALFKRMERLQIEGDISLQPVPSVPARSSSAWNPLLRSTLNNAEPTLQRWRGSLDTLLIFVGLFSAIVTAFFVDSLKRLQPDEVARTNELIVNLTNTIIILARVNATGDFGVAPATRFVPNSGNVRINVYWSLALISSILVAALAVAGRAFLASLTRPEGDAVAKLTQIYQKWATAKRYLGPFLEALPLFLMVPFTLFISGLLDMLFSTSITSSPDIFPILAASILSCTLVVMVGLLLCFAVMHGIKHPTTSPFQTSFSKFFSALCFADSKHVPDSESPLLNDFKEERELTASSCEVFHLALQETFDDETIDQASAALEGVLKTQGPAAELYSVLSDLGLRTILHLLSPEASLRSNLSAARIVTNLVSDRDQRFYASTTDISSNVLSPFQRDALLTALLRAAEHHLESRLGPRVTNWYPNFILTTAMASLIPTRGVNQFSHPTLTLLSANRLIRQGPQSELRKSYNAVMWYGISTLIRMLRIRTGDRSTADHILDEAVLEVLGPCVLRPEFGEELLSATMHSPPTTQSTTYQDLVDYETIADCLVRWVAGGENAFNTTFQVVDRVLIGYFNPDPHNYQPDHRSYHRVVPRVMMLVYQTASASSLHSLLFCTKFILTVQETFIWDVGRFRTLRIVSTFLALLQDNVKAADQRDLRLCKEALKYVYQWTLYRASSFGEYDIDIPEFQDRLPPRNTFLAVLRTEWSRLYDDENISGKCQSTLQNIIEIEPASVPLPLPGWGSEEPQ